MLVLCQKLASINGAIKYRGIKNMEILMVYKSFILSYNMDMGPMLYNLLP